MWKQKISLRHNRDTDVTDERCVNLNPGDRTYTIYKTLHAHARVSRHTHETRTVLPRAEARLAVIIKERPVEPLRYAMMPQLSSVGGRSLPVLGDLGPRGAVRAQQLHARLGSLRAVREV